MSKEFSYAQLLETNNLLQNHGEETYWLCVTRTVQESKLFPVSAYILLSYLNAFYRWPTLLRKIEKHMPAERIVVAPDCGMKYLPRDVAFGKMQAMVEGAAIVRAELGA